MAQPRFGELLWQAIQQTRANTGRNIGSIKDELAALCYVSEDTVDSWKRRRIPPSDTIEHLARWGVEKAGMKRSWLSAFLQAGDCYDGGTLERQFFGDDRTALPNVRENLPPLRSNFIPRPEAIDRVREGLTMPHPLVSIEGMSGVGKTTLARKVARMCLAGEISGIDPFEAIVWMSAKGKPNDDISLTEALDTIAEVLGYATVRQLTDKEKRAAVDRLLRAHRTLVIVDNFETVTDPELADFLQRVPPPSKAIITTRVRHLRRLWDVDLHGLAKPEAFRKIREHSYSLGLHAVAQADEATLLPLVAITEGNPKAIEMALGYIKEKDMALDEVVHSLAEANEDVEDLFKDLFARAWELLPEEGRRLLMVMPFFADSASREALAAAAGVHGFYLRTALAQLLDMSLLETTEELVEARKRYSAHPLVLAFAGARLKEQPEFEEQARARWCDYFLEFATRHLVQNTFEHRYWNSIVMSRTLPLVNTEWPNLQKVLVWADQKEQGQTLIELMMLLAHYLDSCLLFDERVYYARKAAEAAKKLGRKSDEALFRIDTLGWTLTEQGRFKDAEQEIKTGLDIAKNLSIEGADIDDLIAFAYAFLARVNLEQGDVVKASKLMNKIKPIDCQPVIQNRVYMIAGDIAHKKKDHSEAIRHYEDAIRISSQYKREGEDIELHNRLGFAYLAQEDFKRAEAEFEKILALKEPIAVLEIVSAKYGLAQIAKARDEIDNARQLAAEAFEELSRLYINHRLVKEIEDFLESLEAS